MHHLPPPSEGHVVVTRRRYGNPDVAAREVLAVLARTRQPAPQPIDPYNPTPQERSTP
jgi:hypothetical protein